MQRSRGPTWLGVLCAATALVASTGDAFADEPVRYSLSWVRGDGASQCPPRREVAAEVERRLGRSAFMLDAERSLEVVVEREGEQLRSVIRVRGAEGEVLGRRALGSDEPGCDSLFSATVLALALIIDPEAVTTGGDAAPQAVARFTAQEPPAAEVTPADASGAVPSLAPAVRNEEPAQLPGAPPQGLQPGASAVPVSGSAAVQVQGRVLAAAQVLPAARPGASLFVGGSVGGRWGWASEALYVAPARARFAGGELGFGLSAASVSVTFDLLRTSRLRIVADSGPLAGALHATVYAPEPRRPGDFPFLAMRGGLRVEVALGSWVAELGGAGLAPLLRRGFLVERGAGTIVGWRQPSVGALGFVGLGAQFL